MRERLVGTNDVTATVACTSQADALRFLTQLRQSTAITITDLGVDTEFDVPNSVWVVTGRFTNTRKNRWNHYSDARRFVNRALVGVDGELDDLIFNGWTPAG